EGQSRVFVSFAWGSNMDEAANELRTRLDRIRNSLPDGSETPQLFKFDTSLMPIMMLAVSGDMDPLDLRRFAEDQIRYRIERVPGVGQTSVQGGLRREIHINLSLEKLRSLDLSVNDVVNLIRRENENLSAGTVEEGTFDTFLRTQGQFEDLSQIQNLVLTTRGGVAVYLRDIAEIEDGVEDERQTIRVDGRPGVRIQVQKQSGANTVAVARGVKTEVARINRDFPNITIRNLRDNSVFIERSIHTVGEHAVFGSILAVLILLFFLRNIGSTMIVSLAIPISLIGTFSLLYFSGFTLNTVTMGGLALGVGRLVDDAVVVLENIFRHREAGKPKKESALLGTQEVSSAVIASTLTTIIVFLPIAFLSGLASVIFSQLAFTVAFALFCSLLVALTLIPVLCSKYLTVEPPSAERHPWLHAIVQRMGNALERLDVRYQGAVGWALHHRKTVVMGAAAAVAATFLLVSRVGVELMPRTDEGQINVNVELAAGTRLPITEEVVNRIESRLRQEVPEIKNVMVQAGSGAGGGGFGPPGSGTNTAQISLELTPATERERSSEQIAALLNRNLNQEPGVQVRARATGGVQGPGFGGGGGFGGGDRASVEIRGYNLQYSSDLAKRIKDLVESVPGVTDARVSRSAGLPEMLIRVDRVKAATLGLNVNELGGVLQTAIAGTEAGFFRQEGDEYSIVVRLQEGDRSRLQSVDLIPVSIPGGKTVPIGSLIATRRQEGAISIDRQDRERVITVSANFYERDLGSIMRDIQAKMQPLRAELPPDFAILYGGEYEEQQKSFRQLVFALLLAVVLVYMVMAAQYESWRDPFIILFSIPLAAIGVVLTLLITNTNFSIQAFLGVIMLSGIAVSNAILLVDYTNMLRRRDGLSVFDAVTLAGRRRLRPILMTTLTTSLALMPMALGLGQGGEVQAPMARVVIGGLLTSTAITLLFIPTLYAIAEERSERRAAEAARRSVESEPLFPAEAD
ncbi:MAG: efflux RND transporter permease subunit, partial [Acidobacteria bacterium]|nr:efflux RND transporter permease subunit [Acidobacteriota bacterium]